MIRPIICALTIVALIFGIQSCGARYFRSNYRDANSLIHGTENLQKKPFLKAHLKNGNVCIVKDSWIIDTISNSVVGTGTIYDFNRHAVYQNAIHESDTSDAVSDSGRAKALPGTIHIPIDSVAIFETNTKIQNPEAGRIIALCLMAAADIALGVVCATNPKACFGSCPTFYLNENDNFHYADAEGFSSAISPSMEYSDVDALTHRRIADTVLSITMKNEALETHCVKDVKLLACPIMEGKRVYQTPANTFYLCENEYALSHATACEGDITGLLKSPDGQERFSLADSGNLSSKEECFLTFDDVESDEGLGLIMNFRQTLMTTYFIYSAMGYMGDEVGDFFAKIEMDNSLKNKLYQGMKKELGNIDVFMWDEREHTWNYQGGFFESGPIAINKQFIPLQNAHAGSTVTIKLVLNKGFWRMDYAGLTTIKRQVEPIEISPTSIFNKGVIDERALNDIMSKGRHLISMPGSEYKFNFKIPRTGIEYELFLYSKGYYLEWMRTSWIKDKDMPKLRQLVESPKKYLREEAGNYKQYETTMEQEFWNSKIATKSFSYYAK
jgi:hypothetical protein